MVLAFKEPAQEQSVTLLKHSRGWILLELEMISSLPIIFKLFLE